MESIDLHGVKHEDVKKLLDEFFFLMIKKNVTEFEIITGWSSEMKRIVHELCDEYKFEAKESLINGGSLIVK